MPEELRHNPMTSLSSGQGEPLINQILNGAVGTPDKITMTDPTFFDCQTTRSVSISVQPVDDAGLPVSELGSPIVDIHRSLDNGYSWQFYKQLPFPAEVVESISTRYSLWRFALRTKGTNNVRVRART